MHPVVAEVTARIEARSQGGRADYLDRMETAREAAPGRSARSWTTGA